MALCAEYRIPHSHFLGGPPVWTKEDRDKAIWFQVRQRQTCPGCGTRQEEWEGDHNAYTHDFAFCRGCEVRSRGEAELKNAPEGEFPEGVTVTLRRLKKG